MRILVTGGASMFVLLGKLDKGLQAAFDFDYWLRAFLAFPGRMGFVDALQASSRLHEDCITKRMRRRVALEGMQVLARHLGSAPKKWLLTYVDELLCSPSVSSEIQDLRTHIKLTLDEAASWLQPQELQEMKRMIEQDSRF